MSDAGLGQQYIHSDYGSPANVVCGYWRSIEFAILNDVPKKHFKCTNWKRMQRKKPIIGQLIQIQVIVKIQIQVLIIAFSIHRCVQKTVVSCISEAGAGHNCPRSGVPERCSS